MHWLMVSNKRRFLATGGEFDLAPQQMIALRILGGGPLQDELDPRPRSVLRQLETFGNRGIDHRLEERGLARRDAAEGDRRVKLLVLTEDWEWMRSQITRRMAALPALIASLSKQDQRALRDILKRALESASDESDAPEPGRNSS